MKKLQNILEQHAFGVCARIGEILNLPSFGIRVFFIYASFLTFGSPIIIYFTLAFIMDYRRRHKKRTSVWYY